MKKCKLSSIEHAKFIKPIKPFRHDFFYTSNQEKACAIHINFL